jgi:hypothetical protein
VIAVVGNPTGRRVRGAIVAAGLPVAVARSAVVAGGAVQVIGKVGDGTDGDAILLSLAVDGVGHVALLRDLAAASIEPEETAVDPDLPIDELADLDDVDADERATARSGPLTVGPPLDAADLELALRYLPDYRVVVIAQPLDAAALAAVVEATRWSGAQLIVVASGDAPSAAPLPDGATILEAPSKDAEGAFATVVGRYAAALDEGMTPAAAFAAASGATGWTAVAD